MHLDVEHCFGRHVRLSQFPFPCLFFLFFKGEVHLSAVDDRTIALTNRRGSGRTRAIEDARSSRRHKVRTCAHKVRGDNGSGVVKLGCEEKLVPGNLDKLTRRKKKKKRQTTMYEH